MRRNPVRRTVICIGAFVLATIDFGTVSMSAEGEFVNPVITNCTTITQPGSYVVTNNITATAATVQPTNFPAGGNIPACIVIATNFVTLDLAGHTIDGSTLSVGAGISSYDPSHDNVTFVHSGIVANFPNGGVALTGDGHTVKDVRAIHNGAGISLFGSLGGFRVIGNTVLNNRLAGLTVSCPAVLLENVATGNVDGTDAMQIQTFGTNCVSQQNSPAP